MFFFYYFHGVEALAAMFFVLPLWWCGVVIRGHSIFSGSRRTPLFAATLFWCFVSPPLPRVSSVCGTDGVLGVACVCCHAVLPSVGWLDLVAVTVLSV